MKTINSPHVWPAEWASQAATWIAWPHNLETWPGHFTNVPNTFVRFITELSRVQRVHVLSGPAAMTTPTARERLGELANVTIHDLPTNDCWIRDYGPTFVSRKDDGATIAVDWRYNAWGGKYTPFDDDARAAQSIAKILSFPQSRSSMHCEGGALEGNGEGLLMTTSSCLFTPTRNPGWPVSMVETELKLQLGVHKILWVDGGGLAGDDTDGHIDQLARFVSPNVVVVATSSRPDDPNHQGLQANLQILKKATDLQGAPLTVMPLPTPPPRFVDGIRVPESYCNFVFANGIVLVPTFRHDQTDHLALDLLGQLIPNRRIVPLDAYDLVFGLGAFHCASQQQPSHRPAEVHNHQPVVTG
ncbi:agmatine deiminase family protein [Aureliella helgolandensis]|uniref:Agmatine deiminase n=1 Tax=Aureliella helgolandensis TaxID=2527968 RepID=A0A518G0R1_9BACT|nr:agmatine deiminase family protein [Aureliella helgolandensis]QDV22192.1 Agmatine deiminase [Aureliella helgolandensis]